MNQLDQTLAALQRDIEKETLKGMPAGDEIERYLAEGSRMLQAARARLMTADQNYRQRRQELVEQLKDDLHWLDADHEKTVAALRGVISRLEGLR